jgi:hypothetical protein
MKPWIICLVAMMLAAGATHADNARISFFAQTSRSSAVGGDSVFNELVTSLYAQSAYDRPGWEYGLDVRVAGYPSQEARGSRISVYNAYVGQRMGSFGIRVGQMWLNELGALGSVGGGLLQYKTGNGLRFGAFGGLEPKILEAGYTSGIRKFGGFMALEGKSGRSHVLGYANLRNSGLTERSVLVFNNYVPVSNKFFLYQAAEYDLVGPAGKSGGGLAYFFVNGRYEPTQRLELQGMFHHGRSIDTRTITQDVLNGRPVDQQSLQGLLYESVEGRATVLLIKGIRVFTSYGRDRNNRDDVPTGRTGLGLYSNDLAGSGMDFRVQYNRMHGAVSSYDSWSVSSGRNIARKLYLSAEYSSSLSVFQLTDGNGFLVVNRPKTKRFSISSLTNLSRTLSLLLTFDRTTGDDYSENRILAGVTLRFY